MRCVHWEANCSAPTLDNNIINNIIMNYNSNPQKLYFFIPGSRHHDMMLSTQYTVYIVDCVDITIALYIIAIVTIF